jgi:predicted phosphodiesterase
MSTTKPEGSGEYPPLTTYDRLSGRNLSRSALVNRISAQLGLSAQLIEIAILLVEAHMDLALATQKKIVVRDIEFSYCVELQSGERPRRDVDHTMWSRELHAQILKGITKDRFLLFSKSKRSADIDMLSQGLLVGAAFRLAAPLQIIVPENTIDSIIEGLDKFKPAVRILQISDLHFGDDIYDKGGQRVKSGFMKTHDFRAAIELGEAVQRMDRRYDVLVATGDLTTHGDRQELLNAQEFITAAIIPGRNTSRLAAHALKASEAHRILLPGNHDHFGPFPLAKGQNVRKTEFENLSELRKKYPYVVGYRADPKAVTVLFFVFDSTLVEDSDNFGERLAMGNVSEAEITESLRLSQEIVKNPKPHVDDLRGHSFEFDPKNSVRIGLLHHHPILRQELSCDFELEEVRSQKGKSAPQRIWELFLRHYKKEEEHAMRLENGPEFVEGCWQCGIQIVLFGHRHETWGGSYKITPSLWRMVLDDLKKDTECYDSISQLRAQFDGENLKLFVKEGDENLYGKVNDCFLQHINESIRQLAPGTCRSAALEYGVPITPFGEAPESLHFLCCPSALEHKAERKGFYVFDVADLNKIRLDVYMSSILEDNTPSPFIKTRGIEIPLLTKPAN